MKTLQQQMQQTSQQVAQRHREMGAHWLAMQQRRQSAGGHPDRRSLPERFLGAILSGVATLVSLAITGALVAGLVWIVVQVAR